MTPPLTISSSVIDRLQHVRATATGRLYGVMYNNALTVLTFTINENANTESSLDVTALQPNMPAEIDLCGVLFIGDCEERIPEAFKDIDITDNPLLIEYKDANIQAYYYVHEMLQSTQSVEVISDEDIWQRFYYIRLRTSCPVITTRKTIVEILQEIRKHIASGNVGFTFAAKNLYLLGTDDDSKEIPVAELMRASWDPQYRSVNERMTKNVPEIADAIEATMLWAMSREKLGGSDLKCAPALHHVKCPFESLHFNLHIDALSVVGTKPSASQLYAILVESVCRNIRLIERSIVEQLKGNDKLRLPLPMHFKPRTCGHLITVAYPVGIPDDELQEYRRSLHRALALDLTRPRFRRGNAVNFLKHSASNEPLLNPHAAIVNSPQGENIACVDGLYAYHHYMQGINDSGWGCAYRSLQTIVSWYRLQGYTDQKIPSHRDIQKCLVEIGDKASNFIGSKQWIGSTEVGFVLETLLGITIKILCAANGEEMSDLASDLAHHFKAQGTPVMIGGGVLAHTILGINYSETSDDVQYLILDPHYEGPDDLTQILAQGWCGWKGQNFWKKDAFYNMCLPQRPIAV